MHFALLAWPDAGHELPTPTIHPAAGRRTGLFALLLALIALLLPSSSQAAGGHHAVDDASIMEAGQCQFETWLEDGREHHLQHLGPACRVGPVELGANLDRYNLAGSGPQHLGGLQLKWARELQPGLSWGLVGAVNWQSTTPRYLGPSLLAPLTWIAREDLTLHLNLGRDFHPGMPDHWRYGAALEWQPSPQWQGVAEHWRDGFRVRQRLGLRYFLSDALSLDLSRARARGAPADAWWTLGLNWAFAR